VKSRFKKDAPFNSHAKLLDQKYLISEKDKRKRKSKEKPEKSSTSGICVVSRRSPNQERESASISPTVFHMFEKLLGKRVLAIIDRDFGFEGMLVAVSQNPSGIWLSDAEAVVLRSTLASPIPQVVGREKKRELFVHLDSVLRLETMPEGQ